MSLGHRIRHNHRLWAVFGGFVIAATAVTLTASGAFASAASTASKPAGGTIHVYLVNTGLNPSVPANILITGAFSDHGTGKGATWHLARGTITLNPSKLKAILNSPSFGNFYAASCSFDGAAEAKVPVVSGTGAYKGITGSIGATAFEAEQGSLLKNGKCNTSNNAPALAGDAIIIGSGKVTFKK
jgi:hypothetical protein